MTTKEKIKKLRQNGPFYGGLDNILDRIDQYKYSWEKGSINDIHSLTTLCADMAHKLELEEAELKFLEWRNEAYK